MMMRIEPQLPWSSSFEDDKKFLSILGVLMLLMLVFGIIIPNIDLPELTREEKAELPPQLAKILLKEKKIDKPKPKPKPVEVKQEEPKVEEKKPEPKPVEKPPEEKVVKAAIEKAKNSGLLALQDDLADLRESFDLDTVKQADLDRGQDKANIKQSQVIAKSASAKSAGVNAGAYTTNLASTDLQNKQAVKINVPTSLEGSSGSSGEEGSEDASKSLAGRSEENIRSIMERQKGALYAIYNRALRKNPILQGVVEFQIEISASGAVSSVKILSSSLADEALERKLTARIRLINFGQQNVATTTTNYRINFFPS